MRIISIIVIMTLQLSLLPSAGSSQHKNSDNTIWFEKNQYEYISPFSDGVAEIYKNSKYGLINKEGKVLDRAGPATF